MVRKTYFQLFLRIALALSMLSAVADRFGFWGANASWGNWTSFEVYTRELTFFLPENLSIISAYVATFLEALFSLLLFLGFKTKIAAYGTALLLLIFAISMSIALGIKAPFDYSVWTSAMAALLLAGQASYAYSIDSLVNKKD